MDGTEAPEARSPRRATSVAHCGLIHEPERLESGDVVEVLKTGAIIHQTGRAVVTTVSSLDLGMGDRYTVRFEHEEYPYPMRFPRGALRLLEPARTESIPSRPATASPTPGDHTPQDTSTPCDRPTPSHAESQAAFAPGQDVLFERPMRGAQSNKWVGKVWTRRWLPEAGEYAYVVVRTGTSLPEIFLHHELQARRGMTNPPRQPASTTPSAARGE